MPQTNQPRETADRSRLARLRDAMQEHGLQAVIIEPGPAMQYLTGVRWGRSERTFALVVPREGSIGFVVPGFEEMRARELIPPGAAIRVWQEDENPFQQVVNLLQDRGIASGRIGIDPSVRFFVFDGVRKLAPEFHYVSAQPVLDAAGIGKAAPTRR
jgi:Xaa-Pro dipeptidase